MAVSNLPAIDMDTGSANSSKQPPNNTTTSNADVDGDVPMHNAAHAVPSAFTLRNNAVVQSGDYQLYFDTLIDDLIDNTVKHLSDKAMAELWARNIPASYIIPMYTAHKSLGVFVANRFDALACCPLTMMWDYVSSAHWIKLTESLIRTTDADHVKELVRLNGRNLVTLIMGHYVNFEFPENNALTINDYMTLTDEEIAERIENNRSPQRYEERVSEYMAALIDDIRHNCPKVNRLLVESHGKSWMGAIGHQLTALKIARSPDIPDIVRYCPQLEEISIKNIPEGIIEQCGLWRHLGPTLKSLRAEFEYPCGNEIPQIQQHCRHLTYIHINGEADTKEALADLLVGLGKTLRYAELRYMKVPDLKRVVAACTNAMFGYLFEKDLTVEPMHILGKQLKKCIFLTSEHRGNYEPVAKAWEACTNMEKIRFSRNCESGFGARDYEAFSRKPKHSLKLMSLHIPSEIGKMEDQKKIMDLLALGTGNLEKVSMSCIEPTDAIVFTNLIWANRNSLTGLYLHLEAIEDSGVKDTSANNILIKFLDAPYLKDTCIRCDVHGSCLNFNLLPQHVQKELRLRRIVFDGQ